MYRVLKLPSFLADLQFRLGCIAVDPIIVCYFDRSCDSAQSIRQKTGYQTYPQNSRKDMSLFKDAMRPCRSSCQMRNLYIVPKKPFHQTRELNTSPPIAGAAEEEVQAAHRYCLNLLEYAIAHSSYTEIFGAMLTIFVIQKI